MVGVEAYPFAVLLILAIICIYFTYRLFRITRLRSWLLVILGFGLLIAWQLLALASLVVSAWLLISNVFLLLIVGPLTLGLWQLKRRFSRIYRHVNEAN
ncbi:MAG TPA: hypothetical protein VEH56_06525 [Candidatus Saccharimonadales bacterium]|nr:hypothetical protein [Candidatus Saccharimonadales bacterium]